MRIISRLTLILIVVGGFSFSQVYAEDAYIEMGIEEDGSGGSDKQDSGEESQKPTCWVWVSSNSEGSSDDGSGSGSAGESDGSGEQGEYQDWPEWKESCGKALTKLRKHYGKHWVKGRNNTNDWLKKQDDKARSWFDDRWSEAQSGFEGLGKSFADTVGLGGNSDKESKRRRAEYEYYSQLKSDSARALGNEREEYIKLKEHTRTYDQPGGGGHESRIQKTEGAYKEDLAKTLKPFQGNNDGAAISGSGAGSHQFATPRHTTAGQNLEQAWNYRDYASDLVEKSQGENLAHQRSLISSSELFLHTADEAYVDGDYAYGDRQVDLALKAIDAAVGFVPGLGLASDLYSVIAGENFFTGEALSDTEQALILGSILVPAAISGTAKVMTKFAAQMAKYAKSSSAAEELYKTIRNSDEFLSFGKQLPCGSASIDSEKSFLEGLRWLRNFVDPAAFASNPCIPVGKTTGDLIDSAKKLEIPAADLNRVLNQSHHVFGPQALSRHKLEGVLESFNGDKMAAFKGIENAVQAKVNSGAVSGIYNSLQVTVNGFTVTVKGNVIDGVAKVSTAFIP